VIDQYVADCLLGRRRPCGRAGDAIDYVVDQMEPVEVIQHAHVEGGGGRSRFLVTAHMDVVVTVPPIGEAVNEPRIDMEGEDDRLVDGEEGSL
jgi:hypothetical protein